MTLFKTDLLPENVLYVIALCTEFILPSVSWINESQNVSPSFLLNLKVCVYLNKVQIKGSPKIWTISTHLSQLVWLES